MKVWKLSAHIRSLIGTLEGHTGDVNAVAFSPDGKRVASGSSDLSIKVWDVSHQDPSQWTLLRTLNGHGQSVKAVVFSPNGMRLASGSSDGIVKVWDISNAAPAQWAEVKQFNDHSASVNALAYFPDGNRLLSGSSDRSIIVWDLSNATPAQWASIRVLNEHQDDVRGLSLSSDGKRLASCGMDKNVIVWNFSNNDPAQWGADRTFDAHTSVVNGVALVGDGKTLCSGDTGGTLKFWNLSSGNPNNWSETASVTGHKKEIHSISLSASNKRLVSASSDLSMKLWEVVTAKQCGVLTELGGSVRGVAFARSGEFVAAGSQDGRVRLWRSLDATHIRTLNETPSITGRTYSIAISPDDKFVVMGMDNGAMGVFKVADGDLAANPPNAHTTFVTGLAFSSDGSVMVSGSDDRNIRIWNTSNAVPENWNVTRTIANPTNGVSTVALTPNGAIACSGDVGGKVRWWKVSDGSEILNLNFANGIGSVAISPDGKLTAIARGDAKIDLYEIEDLGNTNGTPWERIRQLDKTAGTSAVVAFSADGKTLASYSSGATRRIKLWKVENGTELASYDKEIGSVNSNSIAFDPKGELFAYGRADAAIVVAEALQPKPRPGADRSDEGSSGGSSVDYNASLGVLSFTGHHMVDTGFPGDSVLGGVVSIPSFTLIGAVGPSSYLFQSDPDSLFRIEIGPSVFLTAHIPVLSYEVSTASFHGELVGVELSGATPDQIFYDEDVDAPASPWIAAMRLRFDPASTSFHPKRRLWLTYAPTANMLALTQGFTINGSSGGSDGIFGARPEGLEISVPGSPPLASTWSAAALLLLGLIALRRGSRSTPRAAVMALLVSVLLAAPAEAKRIIFLTNTVEMTWGEGYYKQNAMEGDTYVRESDNKTLADAWGMIEQGDVLIIIAHGGPGTITLGGQCYGGFKLQGGGGGTGVKDPYALTANNKNNVSVQLKVCHSARDPDANGPKISVKATVEPLLTGTGTSVSGANRAALVEFDPQYKAGTAQQKQNTLQCLADAAQAAGHNGAGRANNWLQSMTYTQHQGVAAVIQACRDAGKDVVNLNIVYSQPQQPQTVVESVATHRGEGEDLDELVHYQTETCTNCGVQVPVTSTSGRVALAWLLACGGAILILRRQMRVT